MLEAQGWSIWLEPVEPVRQSLGELIERLGAAHGSPAFPPHVTLIGEFPLEDESLAAEMVAETAASLPPFPITFTEVGMEDVYWRTLYLRATLDDTLKGFFERMCERMRIPRATYRPHLSLMYTDLDRRARQKIAENELGIRLPIEAAFDRVSLRRTQGHVEKWSEVGSYAMMERRRPWARTV